MTVYYVEQEMGGSGWCVFEKRNGRTVMYLKYATEEEALDTADRLNQLDRDTRRTQRDRVAETLMINPPIVPDDPVKTESKNQEDADLDDLFSEDLPEKMLPADEEAKPTGLEQVNKIIDSMYTEQASKGAPRNDDDVARNDEASGVEDPSARYSYRRGPLPGTWQVIRVDAGSSVYDTLDSEAAARLLCEAKNSMARRAQRLERLVPPHDAATVDLSKGAPADPWSVAGKIGEIDDPSKHRARESRTRDLEAQLIAANAKLKEARRQLESGDRNLVEIQSQKDRITALAKEMSDLVRQLRRYVKDYGDIDRKVNAALEKADVKIGEADAVIQPPDDDQGGAQ